MCTMCGLARVERPRIEFIFRAPDPSVGASARARARAVRITRLRYSFDLRISHYMSCGLFFASIFRKSRHYEGREVDFAKFGESVRIKCSRSSGRMQKRNSNRTNEPDEKWNIFRLLFPRIPTDQETHDQKDSPRKRHLVQVVHLLSATL